MSEIDCVATFTGLGDTENFEIPITIVDIENSAWFNYSVTLKVECDYEDVLVTALQQQLEQQQKYAVHQVLKFTMCKFEVQAVNKYSVTNLDGVFLKRVDFYDTDVTESEPLTVELLLSVDHIRQVCPR